MSKLNISRLTNENEDGAPYISGITTFSSTAFLDPPKGNTAQRPEYVQPGMIRFNTDGAHLEYYNGVEWTEVLVANNSLDGGARGVVWWWEKSKCIQNTIDYVTISTLGNALDFGDLTAQKKLLVHVHHQLVVYLVVVYSPATLNINNPYVTISSTGNAQDFGDLTSSIIFFRWMFSKLVEFLVEDMEIHL
jgi:hypothetical protein